jgi:hypothetical protein
MGFLHCAACGKDMSGESAQSERRGICFGCHVKTVSIGFSYGKESFHGPTIRERQEQTLRDAAAAGVDVTPVGSRWV